MSNQRGEIRYKQLSENIPHMTVKKILMMVFVLLCWLDNVCAEDLGKEERIHAAQSILREASRLIPKISEQLMVSSGSRHMQSREVSLLEDIAKLQGQVGDQEGLRSSAGQAVHIVEGKSHSAYPLTLIGNAQVEAGFADDGAYTAEAALEVVLAVKAENRNIDAHLFNILDLFMRAGKFDRAVETATMISREFQRAHAFAVIAFYQSKAGNHEEARKLDFQSQSIANGLENTKRKAELVIFRAKRQMEGHDFQKANKMFREANVLINELPNPEDRAYLLRQIAVAHKALNGGEIFLSSLEKVIKEIKSIHKPKTRAIRYLDLTNTLFELKQRQHARQLINKAFEEIQFITDPCDKASTLFQVGSAQLKLGEEKRAKETMSLGLKALEDIKKLRDRIIPLQTLLWTNNGAETLQLSELSNIQKFIDAIPNDEMASQSFALMTLAELQVRNGFVDQALVSMNRMQETSIFRGMAIKSIATVKAETEDFRKVMEWARDLTAPLDTVNALIGIANGIIHGITIKVRPAGMK